jgi:hypothetical protein
MNNKVFNIDHQKLIAWLVPARIRRTRLLAFLKVMISGVVFLYQDFTRFRAAKLYQLKITPQVCYLETLLNDRYDSVQRRIYITDGIDKPPFYIYIHPELKPRSIFLSSEGKPRYIYTAGESGLLQDDFIVMVPVDIAFEPAEMRSLVKAYKLGGTRFKIQTF